MEIFLFMLVSFFFSSSFVSFLFCFEVDPKCFIAKALSALISSNADVYYMHCSFSERSIPKAVYVTPNEKEREREKNAPH